jgi:hypothetical protein
MVVLTFLNFESYGHGSEEEGGCAEQPLGTMAWPFVHAYAGNGLWQRAIGLFSKDDVPYVSRFGKNAPFTHYSQNIKGWFVYTYIYI